MRPEPVKLKGGQYVRIRLLAATDLLSLHKMYRLLSEESKEAYRPTFFQQRGLEWLVANFALLLSTFTPLKMLLMHFFPRGAIIAQLVAINDKKGIVAFAHFNVKQRLADGKYSASFGLCVRDDYQGRGLGSKLMGLAIELAREEGVSQISSWVAKENYRIIHLHEKYGFKVTHQVKSRKRRKDYLKMTLYLS